jgi:hypothetical protein
MTTAMIQHGSDVMVTQSADAANNSRLKEFSAMVTPILTNVVEEAAAASQNHSSRSSGQSVAVHISEGYDDIFRYIRMQMEQLKQNPGGEQISAENGNGQANHESDLCWQRFKTRFNEVVRDVIHFAKKIPGFSVLDLDDQVCLIKGGCFEVACVVHSAFIDGDDNSMYLQNNSASKVSRDQLKASFLLGEAFIDLMFNFSTRFNSFHLTQGEVALFSALMLISPDRPGLKGRDRVLKLQESLIQSLQAQINTNHPNEVGLFPRLLMIISNLRELSVEHRRMMGTLRTKPEMSAEDAESDMFGLLG